MFCILVDVAVLTGSWLGVIECYLELQPKYKEGYT